MIWDDSTEPLSHESHTNLEGLATIDLLDRLPEVAEADLEAWLPERSILAILEAAERLRVVQEEERAAAPDLAEQLERHPETRARLMIDNGARFRTWGLAESLLERSSRAIFENDLCRAVRIARLGVMVANALDAFRYGGCLAADLRARAWGSLGNAYRCAGQLRAAAAAFDTAAELLDEGTGDPMEEATLLSYQASLLTATGDLPAAVDLLDRISAIYREIGEPQLLARTLVQKSVPVTMADPEEGARVAREAELLLDPADEPRLFLIARHNQIRCLVDSGHAEQAEMLLEASRSLYRRAGDQWTELGLAWTEARIAAANGELLEAEAGFEVLLTEVLEAGRQLDGALVSLDLAACRIALGKHREAAELAQSMAHNLREWGANQRARDAWGLLTHSLQIDRATVELVREIATYLKLAWKNPELAPAGRLARELGSYPAE